VHKAWLVAGALGAAALTPGKAAAEGSPIPIELRGPAGNYGFELEDPLARSAVIRRCASDCAFAVPAGRYRLRVIGADGRILGVHRVAVQEPARWFVSPADTKARSEGLAMGITGSALALGGLMATALWFLSAGCTQGDCVEHRDTFRTVGEVGLIALTAGAILTPIGWSQFARNKGPSLEVQPGLSSPAGGLGSLRFGAAPTAHGAAFAAAFSF
jgi:hypothetical protein